MTIEHRAGLGYQGGTKKSCEEMTTDSFLSSADGNPNFLVIGCGGAGTRIIDEIHSVRKLPFRTIAVETDKQALDPVQADVHILLGENRIKAWGEGDPSESEQAAAKEQRTIEPLINFGDLVFLVAGLGGGAGSGTAPQVARIIRERGALTIALVTLPFRVQETTIRKAEAGLQHLLRYADSVVIFDNQQYCDRHPNYSVRQVYATINGMIADIITGITETLTSPRLINADREDVRALFGNKGPALVLSGESGEEAGNVNESVTRKCLNSPSVDCDYRGAAGCFLVIRGGNNLDLNDTEEIATSLTYELDPHADVVWCAALDPSLEGRVRVYAIITGLNRTRNRLLGDLHG